MGQAMRMPGIATLIPDLVRSEEIPAAVSLNGIAQNSSRMLGPAIAGALIAAAGVSVVLTLNALIMVAIVVLFLRLAYAPPQDHTALTLDRFVVAVSDGFRFAASTSWKRNILIRLGSFFACSAAIPALMAVRFDDSQTYGVMYACFGAGSLLGLVIIGQLGHERLDRRLSFGLFLCGLCILMLGLTDGPLWAGPLLAGAGASWIFCSNSIMVSAQMQLTNEMRGRGLSLVYAVGTACLAGGGLIWGAIARATTPGQALLVSGFSLFVVLSLTHRLSIATKPS